MIIRKYGIELHRISKVDIELLREKRNEDFIKNKMFYQKMISREEQVTWYKSLDFTHEYYFIINFKSKKVGMIHGKILSFSDKTAEGGLFIWDQDYLNSHIPVCASICMADLTFNIMGMNKTFAKVRADNKVAIEYNLSLGYKIISEDNVKLDMELSRGDYVKKSSKFREKIMKINSEKSELRWKDIDIKSRYNEQDFEQLPEYLKKEIRKLR